MRKLLFAAAALMFPAAGASAAPLVYEPFDYAAGPLLGKTNAGTGTTWLRAAAAETTDAINVVAGNLTPPPELGAPAGNSLAITGVGNSSGGANRLAFDPSGTPVNSGTLYYSLTLQVDSLTGANNTTGGFLVAFNNTGNTATTNNPTTAAARLQSRIDPTDATKFNLGIFNTNAAAAATSWTGPLDVGAQYTWNPNAGDDVVSLWVNPTGLGDATPPTPDKSAIGTDVANIASILVRQSPAPQLTLDEMRVAQSWADVTVPEPGALGLAALGLLGLRRQRRGA
jgi:MYXO-CTERM domain-containing protein